MLCVMSCSQVELSAKPFGDIQSATAAQAPMRGTGEGCVMFSKCSTCCSAYVCEIGPIIEPPFPSTPLQLTYPISLIDYSYIPFLLVYPSLSEFGIGRSWHRQLEITPVNLRDSISGQLALTTLVNIVSQSSGTSLNLAQPLPADPSFQRAVWLGA